MSEGLRLGGACRVWHGGKHRIGCPSLERGIAYHLDGVLIAVVDGCLLELAGGDHARISRSLSICVPLISLETS